ncbi:MAG TPA: M6 family metalloprotease domain-containing protein [Spirochaetota bacterium]|nr:M6 family metalloprotease domain-containing protein [Spirochaetota bacterium]
MRFARQFCTMGLALGLATMVALPIQAMPPDPKKIRQAISEGPGGIQRLARRQQAMVKRSMNRPMRSFPTTGNRKIPVIVIAYSDMALASVSTKAFYETLLNGATTASLSMRKYYQDMSAGALNLTIDILGPYTAANTAAYYGQNDPSEYDLRPATLVGEAIDKAELAGVDWAQYDNDGDGEVDVVMVIHAGIGEESTGAPETAIWAHAWDLDSGSEYEDGSGARNYDGKKINKYTIQPEFVTSAGDSTIGVFCHEFGHVLGLPDMYDTTDATHGVGDYSIMANGSWLGPNDGDVPAPFLAWEKAFLGWLTVKYPDGTVVSGVAQGAPAVLLVDGHAAERVGFGFAVLAGLGVLGFFGWRRREIRSIVLPLLVMLAVPTGIVILAGCSDVANSVLGGSLLSNTTQSAASIGTSSSSGGGSLSSVASTSSVPPISGPGSVSLANIEVSHTAIKIPLGDPAGKQYYLIENKVKMTGTWTAYLPGSGLIISHIHDAVVQEYLNGNAVNDNSPDGGTTKQARIHGVNIVEADNNGQLWDPNNTAPSVAADYFKSRSFTPATAPKTFYYTATGSPWSPSSKADSKVYIENISAAGSTMTFTYSYK